MVTQLALAALSFRNQQLFSDYYLNKQLPMLPAWVALTAEATAAMKHIAAFFAAYTPSDNEAQIENDLIRPIFDVLGHQGVYEIQPALKTPDGTKKPDYVFYRTRATLAANKDVTLTDNLLERRAYAVADAKYWERPLDVATKTKAGDPFTNKNPSYQIAFYVQHSGIEWGILTNGRLWRLYHKDTAHKLDRFYEVDLKALVDAGDVAWFLYFYAFFRRAAFDEGEISLAAILQASVDYAQGVGESLKKQVYEALQHVAQGFLDYPRNDLKADDPDTLKEIYDNSLILLYRLLFILYAEARNLLPVSPEDNGRYKRLYSLYVIKNNVAESFNNGDVPDAETVTLWPRLQTLFDKINKGDPPNNVATFNGGLFDPTRHPFLERCAVGDARLYEAIDKLARVDEGRVESFKPFVDYRDLSERHLGTIYEGLLEFHLTPSDADADWAVALVNDKGEKKATGSFYTPDYIVRYIVQETVGPVLDRACADAGSEYEAQVAAILAVNLLDPAMGSGHFLVEATEFIARYLAALEPPEGAEVPAVAHWKRRVVQSCIYGVDLNPLAVELAKLSLWLATVGSDRPLSFLDHHLRCGNSLVGARLEDLNTGIGGQKAPKSASVKAAEPLTANAQFVMSIRAAVEGIAAIEANPAANIADVKAQEGVYAALQDTLTKRYGRAADAVTATYYGMNYALSEWQGFRDWLTRDGESFSMSAFEILQEQAATIAAQKRFFHWELEFPEVFFDATGQAKGVNAGFDAVIGNPPWIRQEAFAADKPALKARYAVFASAADLSSYFMELGNALLRRGGRFGFIVPNKFVRANYGGALRAFLTSQVRLTRLIDFNDLPVFSSAVTYPMIVLTERGGIPGDVAYTSLHALPVADFAATVAEYEQSLSPDAFAVEGWLLATAEERAVYSKVKVNSTTLFDYEKSGVCRGLLTGFNDAFYIDSATRDRLIREDPKSAEIIKPNLAGADVKRYDLTDEQQYIILTKIGTPIDRYPAVFVHLQRFQTSLEKRGDKGEHWWELRACAHYDEFERPKIIYPNICVRPEFAYDNDGFYSNQKTFIMPTGDKYLLAVLNSRVMHFIFEMTMPKLRGGFYEPGFVFMRNVPIRTIVPTTPTDERDQLRQAGITLSELGDEAAVLAFVAARFAASQEQSDVVHDLLAHLAQQMLDLSKERRTTRADFRDWLRDTRQLPVDAFTPKGFLTTFHERTYREFAVWMKRNRHEIEFADNRTYSKAFEDASRELRGVAARIAATDHLIDRIVYALYGLTEDEITIVETAITRA